MDQLRVSHQVCTILRRLCTFKPLPLLFLKIFLSASMEKMRLYLFKILLSFWWSGAITRVLVFLRKWWCFCVLVGILLCFLVTSKSMESSYLSNTGIWFLVQIPYWILCQNSPKSSLISAIKAQDHWPSSPFSSILQVGLPDWGQFWWNQMILCSDCSISLECLSALS